MRIRIEKVPRLPQVPREVLVAVGIWGLYVLGGVILGSLRGRPVETCLFHATTGRPCPGCGSTRAVLSLVQGHWIEAWRYNPLVATVTLGLAAIVLLRLLTARFPRIELSGREGAAFLVLLAAAVLANWAWLLRTLA